MDQKFGERTVKSLLDVAVLSLLVEEPKHGYAVMNGLAKKTGVMVTAGVIYPLLYELEAKELIIGDWSSPQRRTRKIYSLTPKGRRHLKEAYESVDKTIKEIKSIAKL